MNRLSDFSGHQLRRARRDRGFSQTELAQRVDAHRSSVVRWESNLICPSEAQVEKLCEVLEKSPRWFFPSHILEVAAAGKTEPEKQNVSDDLKDPWLSQVPLARLQELTRPALRCLSLPKSEIGKRTGLNRERVEELFVGAPPTPAELQALREGLGDRFDPTPQLARKVTPLAPRHQTVATEDKLDLVLQKLARLEREVLEIRDLLEL